MTSALFVVSEEGYWGEECVEPLATLTDAGVDVTVATPSGEPPVVDERSVDPDTVGEETAEFVRGVVESDDRLADPEPVATASAGDHDALVLPGGHGTEWDVNQDRHVRALVRETVASDRGTALVVCHTVGVLAFVRGEAPRASDRGDEPRAGSDGGFLVAGRDVTGFPNEWEADIVDEHDRMPDGRKLPYRVEDEVRAAGGDWDAELDEDVSVTVDGDLVTARGPESSAAAADALLGELGVERPAD